MPNNTLMPASEIDLASLIHIIRGTQVMLDSDLAALYQVETKRLNEAVKRNKERFPKQFMFQLSDDEYTHLRSQIATSSVASQYGGRRYNPFVFTEQGIAMLSAVLRSKIAIDVSIRIMVAFVKMRRFLINNQAFLSRLDQVELKQLETDRKLEQVFHHIASQTEVKQNIFFQGQIYDAFSFLIDLIQKAKKSIYLIDNYVDTHTLNILSKKNKDVEVTIFTAGKGRLSKQDSILSICNIPC